MTGDLRCSRSHSCFCSASDAQVGSPYVTAEADHVLKALRVRQVKWLEGRAPKTQTNRRKFNWPKRILGAYLGHELGSYPFLFGIFGKLYVSPLLNLTDEYSYDGPCARSLRTPRRREPPVATVPLAEFGCEGVEWSSEASSRSLFCAYPRERKTPSTNSLPAAGRWVRCLTRVRPHGEDWEGKGEGVSSPKMCLKECGLLSSIGVFI